MMDAWWRRILVLTESLPGISGEPHTAPRVWHCLLNTWRNSNVVITSKRRHFDVITSKWRRFDFKTTSFSRNVSAGWISHQYGLVVLWFVVVPLNRNFILSKVFVTGYIRSCYIPTSSSPLTAPEVMKWQYPVNLVQKFRWNLTNSGVASGKVVFVKIMFPFRC